MHICICNLHIFLSLLLYTTCYNSWIVVQSSIQSSYSRHKCFILELIRQSPVYLNAYASRQYTWMNTPVASSICLLSFWCRTMSIRAVRFFVIQGRSLSSYRSIIPSFLFALILQKILIFFALQLIITMINRCKDIYLEY